MHKITIALFSRGYEESKGAWDFQHHAAEYAAATGLGENDLAAMLARQRIYAEFPTRGLACGGETGKLAWGKIAEACKGGKLDTTMSVQSPVYRERKTMTVGALGERCEAIIRGAYAEAPKPAIVVDGVELSQGEIEALRKLRSSKPAGK